MLEFFVLVTIAIIVAIGVARRRSDPKAESGRFVRRNLGSQENRSQGIPSLGLTPPEPQTPRWLGREDVLQVKGFEIASPMTYVTPGRGPAQEPSEIDRSLSVTEATDAEELPYWPRYSELSPAQRYIYLQWLASGRESPPPNDGYLFVYYYGLERRAIADDADHKGVFREVQRLRLIYAKHGRHRKRNSFMNYSSAFLWFMAACRPELIRIERIEILSKLTRVWTEDKLAAALAWFAQRNVPLPTWMAYIVAEESPHSRRSVVTKRVNKEFRSLFAKRYRQRFGRGLTLRTAKRDRKIEYHPATSVISQATATVPNALGISSQFKKLAAIWNECIEDLRRLSSVRMDMPQGELTSEAWEALPSELRGKVDHPLTRPICKLIADHTDEAGHVFLRAGQFGSILELGKRDRFTAAQSRRIANTVDHAGFAVEPDARLTGKGYKFDELLAIFPLAYEGRADEKRYGGASCILRFGLTVAEADGRIDEQELNCITEHIENGFDLNEHEQRRLRALRMLLLQTSSDITGLGKRLQTVLSADGRRAVGRLLVAVAAADGVITKGEGKAIRRCYRSMGLSPDELEATLRELGPAEGEAPVTVLPARSRPHGEPIPVPRQQAAAVALNRDAIARIMHETREVSLLLADAMNIEGEEDETAVAVAGPPEPAREVRVPVPVDGTVQPDRKEPDRGLGPPERYGNLYDKIICKETWSREDAEALARDHGHMLLGAIESINEWAFEALGGPLIHEDGDVIEVDLEMLGGSR